MSNHSGCCSSRAAKILYRPFMVAAFVVITAMVAAAQTSINFEAPTYTLGNPNGQDGWVFTGPYDVAVSSSLGTAGFGAQSFRISNASTSGGFGDWAFSKSIFNEAGEAGADNAALSGGVRMSRFVARYSIASAVPGSQQVGLQFSTAADRGDGARMTYLRYEDQPDGIHVLFDDYKDNAPFGGAIGDSLGCQMLLEDGFVETDIATLDRTVPHLIEMVVEFVAGPRNDIVKVYVDGVLMITGTTWEDYFRYCEGNPPRTVDSLIFQARTGSGTAPGTLGNGFLIDNMTLDSGPVANIVNIGAGSLTATPNYTQWFWWNDETDAIDNSLGSFVTGPGTPPYGTGSAQTSVSGSQRRNLATYQFAGTPLAAIGTLKFSTYNPSAGNGGAANRSGYLQFNVDFDGSDTWQRRLLFQPAINGTVIQDTWQEWDTIGDGTKLWHYSGSTWPGTALPGSSPRTWNDILTSYPGVRIRVTDSWFGVRVGNPYPDGYTENIDGIKFGTATSLTIFNFDPLPPITWVDDSWTGSAPGSDPDGPGPATSFGYDAFATIQGGINGVDGGGTVNVAVGTYNEDVLVNKVVDLVGAGPAGVNVIGPIGGVAGSTMTVSASGAEISGFTITRAGNNLADWNDPNLNSACIAWIGVAFTGINIHDNYITGCRTGIDVNNSSGNTIHRNRIDSNRTGLIFRNQTDSTTFTENEVTNNWTVGVLFLDASSGSNSPVQTALTSTFFNNNISGNWYGQIVDRQTGGSLPAPGTTNLKNFSGNWYGTATPVVSIANSAEPGYSALIPVAYGGSSVPPGGQPDILGPASANFDYSPFLATGGDITPGTYGFQGSFSQLNVSPGSAQTQPISKLQEANDLMVAPGTLSVPAGVYPGSVDINKAIHIKGSFTVGGTFTLSNAGAQVSPGTSPGIINSGSLSLTSGSTVNIEINGPNVGSQYDQLNVTGTVDLGGATLNTTLGYTPTAGHSYTIVNNDGSDAVTGTFAGMPEGTVFYEGAHSFKISYVGGTGNDVVITSVVYCNTVSISTGITTLTGVSVNVPINVDDTTGKGLYSTDYTLTYNPAVINAPVVSLGTVSAGSVLTVNDLTPGTLIISIFQSTPWTGAGTLANVSFSVPGLPGTSSPVTFSAFKFNEGTQCLTTSNGLVTVIGGTITGTVTYGNALSGPLPPRYVPNATINGSGPTPVSTTSSAVGCPIAPCGTYSLSGFDGGNYTRSASKTGGIPAVTITSFDSSRIAQHVVGLVPFIGPNQPTVADVSGTGGVTSFDAALIARYVVSLPGSGTTGNWTFSPSYGPSTVYANITGEDYVALLMGDVTGNWDWPAAHPGGRMALGERPRLPTLTAPTMTARSGMAFTVPLRVANVVDQEVTAYQFNVRYDSTVIRPAADPIRLASTVSDGMVATVNAEEPGLLRVAVFSALPLTADGVLANLRFVAVGHAGTATSLTWEDALINEGTPGHRAVDGQVSIIAGPTDLDETGLAGRLLTATGEPVALAAVTITDSMGVTHTSYSDKAGNFRFDGVQLGESYTVSVVADRYTFTPITVSVVDAVTLIDLIAQP
ncbi:MAG: carboxypeptidase regulatory-like domain-containing protein [Chloracidobacterium sp.]|nr:carboxypeptidase regulatory-like domain-containing protein [Chloracidobacterium sp.]